MQKQERKANISVLNFKEKRIIETHIKDSENLLTILENKSRY